MQTESEIYDITRIIERTAYDMAGWMERIQGLFQKKQRISEESKPMELLRQMGYVVEEQEDGALAIRKDGLIMLLNYEPSTKAKLRYRQESPYLVLFSYTNGAYFVNDSNETGYVALLERLAKVRNAPSLLEAATAFLKTRETEQK